MKNSWTIIMCCIVSSVVCGDEAQQKDLTSYLVSSKNSIAGRYTFHPLAQQVVGEWLKYYDIQEFFTPDNVALMDDKGFMMRIPMAAWQKVKSKMEKGMRKVAIIVTLGSGAFCWAVSYGMSLDRGTARFCGILGALVPGICVLITRDKVIESQLKKISLLDNDHILVKLSGLDEKLWRLQSDILPPSAAARDTSKLHRVLVPVPDSESSRGFPLIKQIE